VADDKSKLFHIDANANEEDDELLAHLLRSLQGLASSLPLPSTDGEGSGQIKAMPSTTATTSSKHPNPWPHEVSDIPLDPSIVYGELETNGMRYLILPNQDPPGRLELRLHIDAGANMEPDGQQGLAHFLEHMAFRSSRLFPNDTKRPDMQRLGIDVNAHVNAYTNFEETVYWLGLGNLDEPETLDIGFNFMRDVLDGAFLLDEELEIERLVVLSEIQDKDSVGRRIWKEKMEWLLPDHLLSERFVGGTEESLMALERQQFVDFYQHYYVPQRATFIAVGDMNATDMLSLIHEHFDSVAGSNSSQSVSMEAPDYGTIPMGRGLRAAIFLDEELANDELLLETLRPYNEMTPDTVARRIERVHLSLSKSIVARRLQILSTQEDAPFIWGGAGTNVMSNAVEMGGITMWCKKGRWQEAVPLLEQELRRARLYGFTLSELEEVKADTLSSYERSVASKDTRKSRGLANNLKDSINGYYVVSSPEENLRIAMMALENVTTKVLNKAFSNYWNTTDLNLYLSTSGNVSAGAVEQLEDLYVKSQVVEVTPPLEAEAVEFGYTDFGPPGTVVSDTTQEDLEIRQLILSNNVRVNIKQTDFQDAKIHVLARFGTGRLGQPKNQTYLDRFADYMMSWGALGKHRWAELDRILAGKNVGFAMSVMEDAFTFSGTTDPGGLKLQLQLLTAHFVDPGFHEEAVRWFHGINPSALNDLTHTLGGTFNSEVFGWLMGGDGRFTRPSEDQLFAFQASDARDWLGPQLNNSYLEVSIIGDLNQSAAINDLLETLGALPERSDKPVQISMDDRAVATPIPPQTKTFTYESKVPVAATMAVWQLPAILGKDMSEARRLQVLRTIVHDRMYLHIRRKLGGSYAPRARLDMSYAFDYGFFHAYVEGTPEEMDMLGAAIEDIAKNLTGTAIDGKAPAGTIDQDEFQRAKEPFVENMNNRSNSYWLYSVLDDSQAKPWQLDWSRELEDDFRSITLEEVNALAVTYLKLDQALHITILPTEPGEEVMRQGGRI